MFKVKHGNDILTVYDVKIGDLQCELIPRFGGILND